LEIFQFLMSAMLLTLTTTHQPATDLGYLLRKNPARPQSVTLNFGQAHVFYPEATPEHCTAALLVEIDTVGLVRNRRGPKGEGGALDFGRKAITLTTHWHTITHRSFVEPI
jgi:hypothetical protein